MVFKKRVHELKRKMLLEEASKLFIRDGYANMKIAELAKNTQMSVGTIYATFDSKESLYNHYLLAQIDYYFEMIQEQMQVYSDPKEKLSVIIKIKFTAIIENKNALRENFTDPTFFLNIAHNDSLKEMYAYLAQNIMQPLAQMYNCTKDPLELYFLYDGLILGAMKYWLLQGGDLMSRVDDTMDNFLLLINKESL
ncbi:MAG: TetR/AcrR family transcriptional regulator [Sulfurimonas sp.]|nr:TetR/AcrR family transcriptional regulator [Sulfurimonas sp.]